MVKTRAVVAILFFVVGTGKSLLARQSSRHHHLTSSWLQASDSPNNDNQVTSTQKKLIVRKRSLEPPFPEGLCGGRIVEIPPEETFGIDVNLANINLGGNLVLPPRTISVWLPPDYGNDSRHPTLYVHDGQNAWNDTSSWTGTSWRLTGALTRMADHGLLESSHIPIVVLLPSMDGDFLPGIRRRHLEYGDSNLPFAQSHADFVAETVKPYVDARFRTDPDPATCMCMGSSLGELGASPSNHQMLRQLHLASSCS